MAQQKPNSQEEAQSDSIQARGNPQTLNSEMAKAFQELDHGEKTASALESKLDGIESRIDQLLASIEGSPRHKSSSTESPKPK